MSETLVELIAGKIGVQGDLGVKNKSGYKLKNNFRTRERALSVRISQFSSKRLTLSVPFALSRALIEMRSEIFLFHNFKNCEKTIDLFVRKDFRQRNLGPHYVWPQATMTLGPWPAGNDHLFRQLIYSVVSSLRGTFIRFLICFFFH